MSQELIYNVRFKENQGDIVNIRKELEKLGAEAGKAQSGGDSQKVAEATRQTSRAYKEQTSTLKQLRDELKDYKEALADVQKEVRDKGQATKFDILTQRSLGTAISEVKSQIESATKGNLDYETSLNESGRSLREMKGQLRAIKLAIDEVKDPLGEGAERVEELTTQAGELTAQLKEVEGNMGVFSRNVGNYASANDGLVTSIRSGANALAIFQGPLGPIAGRMNSAATAISRFRQAQTAATASTLGLAGAIKVALIASGVGALIVAFTSLQAFFRRTEEGQERLRVITARLGAVFNVFADRISAFGKVLSDAFQDPKQAIKDLGDLIVENLMNRVRAVPKIVMGAFKVVVTGAQAVGKAIQGIWSEEARQESRELFKQAAKDLWEYGNAVGQLVTGIENPLTKGAKSAANLGREISGAVSQAEELQESMNRVLRVERELGVARAKQNRDLQEARDLVRDLNVDFNTRLQALDKVRESETQLLQQEIANEQERLRIMQEKNDMFDSTAEANQAVADQQARIFKLEQEALQRSMSLRRDENAIIRQRDEFILRSLRRTIDVADRERSLELAKIQRNMEKQGQLVELAQRKEVEFLANKHKEQQALEEAYFQELSNQYVNKTQAREEAALRASQEIQLRGIQIREEVLDAEEQRRRAQVEENANYDRMVAQRELDGRLHELGQRNDRIGMIEEQRRAWEEQSKRDHAMRLEQITQELTDRGIEQKEAEFMAKLRLQEEYVAKSQELDRALSNAVRDNREQMLNAIASLTKNSISAIFGDSKAGAVASAIIDTYAGINKALASSPPPLNFINASAVGAAGLANVRKIMATSLQSKSVDSSAAQVSAPTPSFGFVDLPGLGADMASQTPPSPNMQPNIILEGEFDPEFLSVKLRQGNDTISGNTLGIGV